jgi:glyoxylase-like metal-dependent hydrolase (beta-lactamase superfamily II)
MILEQATDSSFHALFTAKQMQASGINAKICSRTLRSGVTVLSGSGANIAVFDGPEGKVMIDSGFAVSQVQIEHVLSAISSEPLRYLVNTHWHFDHADGNGWVHDSGAIIIGHRNSRVRMKQEQVIPAFEARFCPASVKELPTVVFENDLELELNSERIMLSQYAPAHTDSDISVYFEQADVLHVGDTWFSWIYPFIDYDGGGSLDGMISAAESNLRLAGPDTIVIPGHGNIGDRNDLFAFHNMLVDVRSAVAALKQKGAPVKEVVSARPTAPFDDKWNSGFIPAELFTAQVYQGV